MRLHNFSQLSQYDFGDEPEQPVPERLSQKPIDIFSREVLAKYPQLAEQIMSVLEKLTADNEQLPLIHFTTDRIKYTDGREISTGFVENIEDNGFRARDTNMGAFIGRNGIEGVGDPKQFVKPEELVKSYKLILDKYLHHGIRTNKQILGGRGGIGQPVMILVNGDLPKQHGTDYENHFILTDGSLPTDILGIVSMSGKKSSSLDDVGTSLQEFLDVVGKSA